MSSSSLFSSSSSLSSPDPSPSFPSPATAASRLRRKRRDAISRAAESEWDVPPSTAAPPPSPPSPPHTSTLPPWRLADELICPLASSDAPLPPYGVMCLAPLATGEDDPDELQATLARFSFPSPPPSHSSKKHRRSGEVIVDYSSAPATGDSDGTGNGRGTGPVRRAPCVHCDRGRGNV